jgi:hypothetical protein
MVEDYKKFAEIGKALSQSLLLHTWQVAPQLAVPALADKDLQIETKTQLLNKLLSFDVPAKEDLMMEKPAAQTLIFLCQPLLTLSLSSHISCSGCLASQRRTSCTGRKRALKHVKVLQPPSHLITSANVPAGFQW